MTEVDIKMDYKAEYLDALELINGLHETIADREEKLRIIAEMLKVIQGEMRILGGSNRHCNALLHIINKIIGHKAAADQGRD